MPDIPQMRADGLTDFHLAQLGPAGPRQPAGILQGASGRTETGHRHRADVGAGPVQAVARPAGDEKGQSRIQSARQAENSLAARMP